MTHTLDSLKADRETAIRRRLDLIAEAEQLWAWIDYSYDCERQAEKLEDWKRKGIRPDIIDDEIRRWGENPDNGGMRQDSDGVWKHKPLYPLPYGTLGG